MKKILKLGDRVVVVYVKKVSVKANRKAAKVFCRCLSDREVKKLSNAFIEFLNKNYCIEV